ncbi:MAG: folate family ECF transporter S component, partial [Clostridia bacterium]|nr:folate family ECF transporter S component [Clostridia bacterium]
GLVCGLVLHKRKPTLLRVCIAVICSMLINWLLNSLWLSILYTSRGYTAWLVLRGPTYLIEAPANILLGYLLLQGLSKAKLNLNLK